MRSQKKKKKVQKNLLLMFLKNLFSNIPKFYSFSSFSSTERINRQRRMAITSYAMTMTMTKEIESQNIYKKKSLPSKKCKEKVRTST